MAVATILAGSSGTASALTIRGCFIMPNPTPQKRTLCPMWQARGVDLTSQRNGIDLSYAELREANFEGAKMDGVRLASADMQHSDLHNARLSHSDLHAAKMQRSNFTDADLRSTVATGAKFDNSNFTNAKLDRAQLADASLVDANLSGASMDNVRWKLADLTGTLVVQAPDIIKIVPPGTTTYALDQLLQDPNRPGMRLERCEAVDGKRPTVEVHTEKVEKVEKEAITCWTKPSGHDLGQAFGD
jgi:hypothetical protein